MNHQIENLSNLNLMGQILVAKPHCLRVVNISLKY